ncbi:hypothetical protein P0Y35_18640 [Kiritimatiellaeota bacterium B1221]|nr:hypothetical protein [Kiritimatiellaeota bacterium B1221]
MDREAPGPVTFPAYDASWYRPEQPYTETYGKFHDYLPDTVARDAFGFARKRILGGLIFDREDWRREALELGLKHAEAVDFSVKHYDAGMMYSFYAWLLCDIQLGAYDLLTEDEQTRLTERLRVVADAIEDNSNFWRSELSHMAFNNHRMCHMAVLLALGKVLDDPKLYAPVFDQADDRSFTHYLNGCMMDHGLCYESSTLYHYATSSFLLSSAKVSDALYGPDENLFWVTGANGLSLYDLVSSPAAICFPKGVQPRSGDCYGANMDLFRAANQFVVTQGVYGKNPLGASLTNHLSSCVLSALCWLDALPEGEEGLASPCSRIFPEHGYAVLCQGRKQAFLSGDANGIHHHREGLQLQVEMQGELVLGATDLRASAVHSFSDGIHEKFNRNAFAHSQLQVGGEEQNLRPLPLPIRIWEPEEKEGIVRMAMVDDRGELNDGVHQGRFIFMAEDWVCDCVFVMSDKDRDWRLFMHLPAGGAQSHALSPVAGNIDEPAPFMRVNAKFPEGNLAAWHSGPCQFACSTLQDSTFARFGVEQQGEVQSTGMVTGTAGKVAGFITLIQPAGASGRIKDLQFLVAGNEGFLRWSVCTARGVKSLQARMQAF